VRDSWCACVGVAVCESDTRMEAWGKTKRGREMRMRSCWEVMDGVAKVSKLVGTRGVRLVPVGTVDATDEPSRRASTPCNVPNAPVSCRSLIPTASGPVPSSPARSPRMSHFSFFSVFFAVFFSSFFPSFFSSFFSSFFVSAPFVLF